MQRRCSEKLVGLFVVFVGALFHDCAVPLMILCRRLFLLLNLVLFLRARHVQSVQLNYQGGTQARRVTAGEFEVARLELS